MKKKIELLLGEEIKGNVFGTGYIETVSGKGYFFKSGRASKSYRCEVNGLKELRKAGVVRVPEIIAADDTFILGEFIQSGYPSPRFYEDFGRRLACLHRFSGKCFGFYEDNYIGANPQLNLSDEEEKDDWPLFFFNKRILYQYRMAAKGGYVTSVMRSGLLRLEANLHRILDTPPEPPALLHGDLWSGNYLCDTDGKVVLIDPAVYYGHREADLAMTKVFGAFPPAFYTAYQAEYPLAEGWEYRENVYKLYHVLNHLNLFGRSYLPETDYLFSRI